MNPLRLRQHLINLVHFSGEDLVQDIFKEHAEAILKEQAEADQKSKQEADQKSKQEVKVKVEPVEVKTEPSEEVNMNGVETESKPANVTVKLEHREVENITLPHPMAAIQVADREQQAIRKSLFASVGPHRRALAARRDLILRRHLCNLPLNDSYVEAPKSHDPELLKVATQLFERCL